MKHIKTLTTRDLKESMKKGGCGECQNVMLADEIHYLLINLHTTSLPFQPLCCRQMQPPDCQVVLQSYRV